MSISTSAFALRMGALKAAQLRHWAFLTGQPISGKKAVLQANVLRHLEHLAHDVPRPKRVVSVDMGIRNLAFCAVDAPSPAAPAGERIFKIGTWRRIDLTQLNHTEPETPSEDDSAEDPSHKRRKGEPLDPSTFSPSTLSKTAVTLARDLLSYSPDTILIERQRFRTAGHAAIQEWTVRVNMLEAMLWASFETLRLSDPTPPMLHEISPARVANFWAAGNRISVDPPPDLFSSSAMSEKVMYDISSGKRKIDKQEKIEIVRSWIAGRSDVQLAFNEETINVAAAFERTSSGKTGKLDDLADCLLQAIAWSKWEESQRNIEVQWEKAVAEIEESSHSSNET